MADENLGEEQKHDRRPDEPARARDTEPEQEPEAREPGKEVTSAAEPCEKRRDGANIDRRDPAPEASARMGSMGVLAAEMYIEVG